MKRWLWHKIDPTENDPGRDWHKVELHATDAVHALSVDPDHWRAEKPEPVVEPMQSHDPEMQGATADIDDGEHE